MCQGFIGSIAPIWPIGLMGSIGPIGPIGIIGHIWAEHMVEGSQLRMLCQLKAGIHSNTDFECQAAQLIGPTGPQTQNNVTSFPGFPPPAGRFWRAKMGRGIFKARQKWGGAKKTKINHFFN